MSWWLEGFGREQGGQVEEMPFLSGGLVGVFSLNSGDVETTKMGPNASLT